MGEGINIAFAILAFGIGVAILVLVSICGFALGNVLMGDDVNSTNMTMFEFSKSAEYNGALVAPSFVSCTLACEKRGLNFSDEFYNGFLFWGQDECYCNNDNGAKLVLIWSKGFKEWIEENG